jgi:NitT/TauT family transport system ATP-binding protein
MPPLVELTDVTLRYKTPSRLVTAVRDINFDVEPEERVILLGPSGCGKSSLLKAIGGFIKPVRGSIRVHQTAVVQPGPDRAFVFQEFDQLLPWKTVTENVVFALTNGKKLSRREALERASDLIDKVNLGNFRHAYPNTLSGGMKQRVAIARGLALGASTILMDEPFASLDAITRTKMQDEVLRLWADSPFALIFVTHSIEEAVRLGQKIVVLTPGPGRIKKIVDLRSYGRLEEGDPEFREALTQIQELVFQQEDYVI